MINKGLLLCACLLYSSTSMAESAIQIGSFSQKNLNGWEVKSFKGHTQYQLIQKQKNFVLQASSHGTASGLFHRVNIDLNTTPYLHWSWKIQETLKNEHERTKQGDDFVARVYVVFSGGIFFWQTRAINYVWSSQQAVGSTWANPYSEHAQMIALESGNEYAGMWRMESRNIQKDYQRLFGESMDSVDAIAIMTDTDNTGASAQAWYGDIWMDAAL